MTSEPATSRLASDSKTSSSAPSPSPISMGHANPTSNLLPLTLRLPSAEHSHLQRPPPEYPPPQPTASTNNTDFSSDPPLDQHAVRFAAVAQEIEPDQNLASGQSPRSEDAVTITDLSADARDELRSLARTLQKSQLQENRLYQFAFEPVSLPSSRVRMAAEATRLPLRDGVADGLTCTGHLPGEWPAGLAGRQRQSSLHPRLSLRPGHAVSPADPRRHSLEGGQGA
jgi:hypothetical protein